MRTRGERVRELTAAALVRSTLASVRDSCDPIDAVTQLRMALERLDPDSPADSAERVLSDLRAPEYARRSREEK